MNPDIDQLEAVIAQTIEPTTGKPLGDLETAVSVALDGSKVAINLCLGFACEGVHETLANSLWQALSQLPGVQDVDLDIDTEIAHGRKADEIPLLANVKHIIAVASGKGGVGKSTTTTNLALALAAEGASVGILDADIYGPSQPHMLGIGDQRPQNDGKSFMPLMAHGVKVMSMGFLVTEQTPMVWRGPMAAGALQQILGQTQWGELDYLLVDMPPGTGDIQLTLSQKVPLSGAVIVTTPQNIALLDAVKGIEMFQKVKVPVLGVVENMATHICSSCGHEEAIFGSGGGARVSGDYSTPLLGSLPLSLSIRQDSDAGKPPVAQDANSEVSTRYREIARKLGAELWLTESDALPTIEITDD